MSELNENEKQLGIAWLRAFLRSPHLPPKDDDSGRLWPPMKRFMDLSPFITDDMLPDVFTKLFVARQALSSPPEILETALKHFISKYPDLAQQWASSRLRNEHWVGTIFSEMSEMHELGINVSEMPLIFNNSKDSRFQIWAPDKSSFGRALFAVKDEPTWRKQIPKILLKLLLDGGKRSFASTHNLGIGYHRRSTGSDDYSYCMHQVINALEPFWDEPRFLRVVKKVHPVLKLKHYEDIAKYTSGLMEGRYRAAISEGKKTTLFLLQACVEKLEDLSKAQLSAEINYTTLATRLAGAIRYAQHAGFIESHELYQRYYETLKTATPNPEIISALVASPHGANLLQKDLAEVWNQHLVSKYGPFSAESILQVIQEQQKWALLNCMNEQDACDYLVTQLQTPELKSITWRKMLDCFSEADGQYFSAPLKQKLAAHPLVHESLLQTLALSTDARPTSLRAFSFAGGWGPPTGNPITELLLNIYPEHRERWLILERSFYDNPTDFDNTAFTEVYEIVRGIKGPTLNEILGMTQALGFSTEEFITTLFQQKTQQLSEAEHNIAIMDDLNYPGY